MENSVLMTQLQMRGRSRLRPQMLGKYKQNQSQIEIIVSKYHPNENG